MSEQPPPYTPAQGDVKQGPPQGYPPQPQGYPPQPQGYPPQPQGYPPQPQGYPPQPQGYPPQGYPPQGQAYPVGGPGGYIPVVAVTQQPTTVVVVNNTQYRDVPVNTVCQFCNQQVITRTIHENGTLSWLICVGLCLVGCDLGCCLIPFCVDGCKDVAHHCPSCNRRLGRFARM